MQSSHPRIFTAAMLAIAFFAGGAVMALEIAASRLLAPYFGTSMLIWTNIIGIVLSALALGYWLGGRWADRGAGLQSVAWLLLASGIWALATPRIVRMFSPVTAAAFQLDFGLLLPVVLMSCATFALPVAMLGAINPILVKRLSDYSTHVGKSAGGVGAWSTLGSIFGTFSAGLFFIPFFGTRATIAGVAWLLLGMAVCLSASRKKLMAFLLFAVVLTAHFSPSRPIKDAYGLLYEGESAYHFIQVTQGPDGSRTMLFNAGLGIQSVYFPEEGRASEGYYEIFSMLPEVAASRCGGDIDRACATEPVKVLMLGMAGGTILHRMHERFGDRVSLTAVEIDGTVAELADRYFGIGELPVRVVVEDARSFLARSGEQYDIIIVDAYQNELMLPWQLTTREFWRSVKGALREGGFAAANLFTGPPPSPLLAAVLNTASAEFSVVASGATSLANYMLIASVDEMDFSRISSPEFPVMTRVAFDPSAVLLTDDRAPVEYLAYRSLKQFAR